ncbi:LysR family transcriptional regulator [Vibrio mediterranei]|uniref:LysR family transcriptional regulator n=1 Tax=Vibrio mediterranei TaxID=689 RepID=UPI00148D4933|nr:LysR family transcriptional regulator [Vibrio mediterranei]NOH27220.1 LysR family transcriptional regulator [Vibrio mediterranei]
MKTLEQELSRIDLNLLVSLSVLIKERNVSRAAEKLYLSQPAMSRTLSRLRALFDDPLFYRESNGLQPTTKTLELEPALDNILLSIDTLLNGLTFSPSQCERAFRISVPPLMSRFLTAPLAKAIKEVAPNVSLEEYPSSLDPAQLLKDGQVDFSIHVEEVIQSEEYHCEKIGSTYPVIYGSDSHPLRDQRNISIKDCLEYQFVDLSLDVRSTQHYLNPIDIELANQGLSRNIALKSGQLSTLIESLEETDRLMISSHALSKAFEKTSNLRVIKSFSDRHYLVNIYLIEHRRTLSSPAHIWFKSLMLETLAEKITVSDT